MGNFYFKTYKTNQAALPRFIRELSYLRQFEWGAKGEAFLLNVWEWSIRSKTKLIKINIIAT